LQTLEDRLSQLLATKVAGPVDPKADLRFLTTELTPETVAAIAQRLPELRDRLKGRKAHRLLEKARKAGRRALKKAGRGSKKSAGKKGQSEPTGDWLVFMLAQQRSDNPTWRDTVQLYGMLRMLEAVGSTAAVREMIASYSYFGELVRIDLQRSIERLGEKAVPALIEFRQHDARKVRRWAGRQLDTLGRAIPGEAVSTTDPVVLADVLRAFGRARELDAVRVLLSFCNSDRPSLRQAAREGIGAIGEPATWQLKEAYLSQSGKKAPSKWSWQRTARELFRLYDVARLAIVYEQMDKGLAAQRAGRHEEAVTAFDRVLARVPLFERRAEMVEAYVALASLVEKQNKRNDALELLRRARRLVPDGPNTAKLDSRIAVLEAQGLIEAGTPDRFLLRRALELDPSNQQARELLGSLEDAGKERQSRSKRYLAATVVGLVAAIAMVLLARRRKPKKTVPPKPAEPVAADEPAP